MARKSHIYFKTGTVLCRLLLTVALAQAGAQADTGATQADAAYTAKDWPLAESSYAALTAREPTNARFWYRLGVAQRASEHDAAALTSFDRARALGAGKGLPSNLIDYEVASTYAAMGDAAQALSALKRSADAGFSQTNRVSNDPEWRALRGDPKFSALSRQIAHNAAPCQDPEFQQFDFWIGDWNVIATAGGLQQGTSHISKEMGGCVIWENWTSANNSYFGKSYNTYNVNQKRWEQYWVDNAAGTIFFHGHLNGSVMDYWTEDVPQPSGDKLRRHLQFFNISPTSVRQLSQGSTDGGKSWNVEYDLTYNRRQTNIDNLR